MDHANRRDWTYPTGPRPRTLGGMASVMPPTTATLRDAVMSGSGPLYKRLAAAIAATIATGAHPIGSRLPPERALAADLGVARVTVVAAYDLLREDGLVERRRGSGTVVAARPPGASPFAGAGLRRVLAGTAFVPGEMLTSSTDDIAFSIAGMPGHAELLPAVTRFVLEELPRLVTGYGYAPAGHEPLRQAIADRYTRQGLPTTADEIVVTTGGQQALMLIASVLVGPDAVALTDDPTYPGALDALRAVGARIVGVPTDAAGMRPDLLAEAIGRWHPRVVYLVATHHNPTGVTMPVERRRALADVAARHGVTIVDDLALAGLGLDGTPEPPPLAALAPDAGIVTVGSISKLLWGGLRVGWLRAPVEFTQQVVRLKLAADHGGSIVSQGIATPFIERLDEIAASRRERLVAGCATVLEELRERLPDWRFTRPTGGLSVWVRIPRGTATTLAELAAAHGVIIVPGPTFSPSGGSTDRVRLPYGGDPAAMREGIRRLALAWEAYRPLAAAPERPPMRIVV